MTDDPTTLEGYLLMRTVLGREDAEAVAQKLHADGYRVVKLDGPHDYDGTAYDQHEILEELK